MKKILALALALVMLISLCACGSNEPAVDERYAYLIELLDNGEYEAAMWEVEQLYLNDPNTVITEPNYPTDEEYNLIWEFRNIAQSLESYAAEGYISYYSEEEERSYNGSAALAHYYARLQELGAIDSWLADETYMRESFSDDSITNNRQAYLDRFTILPDMYLGSLEITNDNMGNTNESSSGSCVYNKEGIPVWVDEILLEQDVAPEYYWSEYRLEYDDAGRISQRIYGYGDTVDALVTYNYDGTGKLVSQLMKNNSGETEYTFTYDEAGRLSNIQVPTGYSDYMYHYDYTYDEAGKLLSVVRSEVTAEGESTEYYQSIFYTYDGSGNLASAQYIEDSYWNGDLGYQSIDTISYTCDEQGRQIQAVIVPGDTLFYDYGKLEEPEVYDTPTYVERTVTTTYGDYYFFE